MRDESQRYRYRVDAADQLVWVDERWLAFARENGATELTEERVLGRSIWDFVSGDATRRVFLELHDRIRQTGKTIVVPFRCDSPTLKRHMRLTISRADAGQLLYQSVVIRVEPQRRLRVLDMSKRRSSAILTMCSCCKRALLESRGWLDVEDVSVRLRLFEAREIPSLRYTVCPECATKITNSDNGNAA